MGPWSLRLGRLAAIAGAALVVAGLVPAETTAAAASPKVAIIVGPAGTAITQRYRQAADAAAAVAGKLTPNVVKVYSPNATWPAVEAAVTGASVIVYLGHGNGWPSPYSSVLQAKSMDGFGLNPVAGVDDVAHQYFGEAYISKLHPALGAVVLLSHLCYASGSAEPGMDDGSFGDVLNRVDNFAAGFIAAGAGAVVAEGHQNPAALISAAIRGPASVAQAWTNAAWGHGHIAAYASVRTPGAGISLDPDTPTAGYYRSIVQAAGPVGHTKPIVPPALAPGPTPPPGPPSLASAGAVFGPVVAAATMLPGQSASITLPVTTAASALPASALVGVRWIPLVAPSGEAGSVSNEDPLVVGEASADVVATASASRKGNGLSLSMAAPATPGTYVVLMTLEAADGTPYDVATQALLRPFTVLVPRPIDLRITAPATLAAQPGTPLSVNVIMANTGTQPWGSSLYASIWDDPALDPAIAQSFDQVLTLHAAWLDPTTGTAVPAAVYPLPRALGAPGHAVNVTVGLLTPAEPGSYLLVLSLGVTGSLGDFPTEPLVVPAEIR